MSVHQDISESDSEAVLQVTVWSTDGQCYQLTTHFDDGIHEAVARCLDCEAVTIGSVQLGEDIVGDDGESFREAEIEDGARLGVCLRRTFEDVVMATIALNPGNGGIDRRVLMSPYGRPVPVDPKDPLHVIGDLKWANMGLVELPDIFGELKIDGNLLLTNNKFTAPFPDTFGNLTLGGGLFLDWAAEQFRPPNLPETARAWDVAGGRYT